MRDLFGGVQFGGCECASCKPTNALMDAGFAAWPRGNVAGAGGSKRDYSAHVSACNSGGCTGFHFIIKPEPVFSTVGLAQRLPEPTALVSEWITRSYAWRDSVMPAWEDGTDKRSRPVSVLVAKARQYREQARQERRAA